MDELIKRNDALEIVRRTSGDYATAFSEIQKLPPVKPHVLCEECKNFKTYRCPMCNSAFYDDYCSFGERKDE